MSKFGLFSSWPSSSLLKLNHVIGGFSCSKIENHLKLSELMIGLSVGVCNEGSCHAVLHGLVWVGDESTAAPMCERDLFIRRIEDGRSHSHARWQASRLRLDKLDGTIEKYSNGWMRKSTHAIEPTGPLSPEHVETGKFLDLPWKRLCLKALLLWPVPKILPMSARSMTRTW